MASAIQFIQFVSFSQRITDKTTQSHYSSFSAFWHLVFRHPYISIAMLFVIAAVIAAVCAAASNHSWGERYEFGPNQKDHHERKP